MKQGIIFDLDGTLWDSSEQVVESWNLALERCKDITRRITLDDMHEGMGKTMTNIVASLFPEVSQKRQLEILQQCCEEEEKFLKKQGAVLYPDMEETLKKLKKQYALFIVSNCQSGYIETFFKAHQMGKYFFDMECWGNTGNAKGDNIKLVIERNKLECAVYVGDTKGDQEAAAYAGIPFIYASYGFGTVEQPEYTIEKLKELPGLMELKFHGIKLS